MKVSAFLAKNDCIQRILKNLGLLIELLNSASKDADPKTSYFVEFHIGGQKYMVPLKRLISEMIRKCDPNSEITLEDFTTQDAVRIFRKINWENLNPKLIVLSEPEF
jgi:hypothetical protein